MTLSLQQTVPWSAIYRFYFYGLQGFGTEIIFTAIWEFIVNLNWKFPGNTSVWAFPIYAVSCMVIEQLYLRLKDRVPLLGRACVYTVWTYLWEFSTGFVLRKFDACPWDYTPFDGDFMGLVTLEYAPLWFIASILLERIVITRVQLICWAPLEKCDVQTLSPSNGDVICKSHIN